MKKCMSFIFLILILVVVVSLFNSKVNAFDFASDYFTANNVEITPNQRLPENYGFSDYRNGLLLKTNKQGANVKINDNLTGTFTIDMMPYSNTTYAANEYEMASYANSYQDINALSLTFTNKLGNQSFKVVLNGGANGNSVTVNAHVEYNGEKMGIYYPKSANLTGNTKGANAAGVYTFLYGTSFSNMAVSENTYSTSNVKSLIIEFDPITMCVYGYSYGYSTIKKEKTLIWDFKKATIDGSDVKPLLDSFDEYAVSLTYEDLNTNDANILIYSINNQSFANSVLTNNIGPNACVKLVDGIKGEKYLLPTPNAYDVLEGSLDFKGEVSVVDAEGKKQFIYNQDGNVVSSFSEGCYFLPSKVGKYQITYIAKDSKNVVGNPLCQNIMITDDVNASFTHGLDSEIYLTTDTNFVIPEAKLVINDDTYDADATLAKINGDKVNAITDAGLYQLTYAKEVAGILYQDIIKLYVSNELDNLFINNKCQNLEYGSLNLNNNVQGLIVNTTLDTSSITYKEALDFSYLDGKTPLVSLVANPTKWGSSSFNAITVKLIDADDPNNFVRIYASETSFDDTTYVRAGSNLQRLAGLCSDGSVSQTSAKGTSISHSFNGKNLSDNAMNQTFEVYFDYASKKVYSTNQMLVADLDDTEYFSTVWNGFTGDKFYLEISISGIETEASYLVDKVIGMDLSHNITHDTTSPQLNYNEADFTVGLVNCEYPIPTVTAFDCNSSQISSQVIVTLNDELITVNNGKFLPSQVGRYKITYLFTDNFGNQTVLEKRILVQETISDIVIELADDAVNGLVGETLSLPQPTVTGGAGVVDITVLAVGLNTNTRYLIENYQFKPLVADTYQISYLATDRLGNQNVNTVEISAEVMLSSKPIIEIPEFIPNVLIDGVLTQFANTIAIDYNQNNGEEVDIELALLIGNEKVKIENYQHTLKNDKMNEVVKLIYSATSKITNETAELIYEIPAIKLYDSNGVLNVSQYLITQGFDSFIATDNSIDFTATNSNASIEFIKNVYSNGFQVSFNVPASANNLDKVTLYLTDTLNPNKQIKLDIIKANSTDSFSYLLINNETKVTMVGTFYGTTANRLKVVYDASISAIKDDSGLVIAYLKNYLNGEAFTGFSPEITFKMELGTVTGTAIINLYEIGNQSMSNIDGDYTVPAIVYEEEIERIADINTKVVIPGAKAIDILSFETSLTIRVLSPSKKVIYTSNEGIGSVIDITEYGTYYVYYVGSDDMGNQLNQVKLITVLDDIAPEISLSDNYDKTYKLNTTIDVKTVSVSDNLSLAEEITQLVYTIDPNNVMELVTDKIHFNVKGSWIIRYFAIDKAGNINIYDIKVEVK